MIINGWKLYNNSNINLNFIDNKNSIQAISQMTPAFWVYFEFDLQNKKPTTTWVAGLIMETAGFEPASRGPDTNLSTCVVY